MGILQVNLPTRHELPSNEHEWRPFFPHPGFRKYQREVITIGWDALMNNDIDNIVIQAPTGIGKSAIAKTLAGENAYFLSPLLGLTKQYTDEFPEMAEVKGRRNFPCLIAPGTADGAACTGRSPNCKHMQETDPCPYYDQKFKARDAGLTISNPAYLFRVQLGDASFDARPIGVFDEAHKIETLLMGMVERTLTASEFHMLTGKSLPIHDNEELWSAEISSCIKASEVKLANSIDDDAADYYEKLNRKLVAIGKLLGTKYGAVIVNEAESTHFKPVKIDDYASEYLERVASKRVFMTATVLDIRTFISSLGLDPTRTLYINVTKSPFPKENCKIYYAPCGSMSFNKREQSLKRQVKVIKSILNKHSEKRGVILPHTHAIRKELVKQLTEAGFGDRILTHATVDREAILKKFMTETSKPYVLISTYVTEGFDFKGDIAEFLICSKIPYPFIPDPQIKERMKLTEHEWRTDHQGTAHCPYEPPNRYSNDLCSNFMCAHPCQKWFGVQTGVRFVQLMGRVIRTPEDVGHLYILDQGWPEFLRKYGALIPSWFKDRILNNPRWLDLAVRRAKN